MQIHSCIDHGQRYGDFEIQSEFCYAFTKMQAIWLLIQAKLQYVINKCETFSFILLLNTKLPLYVHLILKKNSLLQI